MSSPPAHVQILVVGGGPAGSYAASALAREGFQVAVFEAAVFPRYHVGESLIPAVRHHLRFIGAEDKIANAGFAHKPGAAMKFTQHKNEGYTDFVALGAGNSVWNVARGEFDNLLLEHAREQGASVFQRTKVTGIVFDDSSRPVSATYTTASDSSTSSSGDDQRTITFDYLVDASGRAGILSNRYFKSRKYNSALRNVATWGYWRGAGVYGRGTRSEGAPWFEALTDESGWAWFIPLAKGITSVGVIRTQKAFSRANAEARSSPQAGSVVENNTASRPHTPATRISRHPPSYPSSPASAVSSGTADAVSTAPTTPPSTAGGSPFKSPAGDSSTSTQRYLASLLMAPGLQDLLGDQAELLPGGHPDYLSKAGDEGAEDGTVRTASDFSYSTNSYAGAGFRIAGDAGAFIDPFFSSGVHLAMNSALSAATSIAASIRGECKEEEACEWHTARVSTSYTRFLVVVLSAYKQMCSQSDDVLTDIGEDSFENAFKALRPVIHGNADLGPRLSEQEVQQTIDFCSDLFTPTSPEQHAAVRARFAAADAPVQPVAQKDAVPSSEVSQGGLHKRTGTLDKVWKWIGGGNSSAPVPGASISDSLFDIRAPVFAPGALDAAVAKLLPAAELRGAAEEEARSVLGKINARRVIHRDFGGMHSLEEEALGSGSGWRVRLERGKLGLVRADAPMPVPLQA